MILRAIIFIQCKEMGSLLWCHIHHHFSLKILRRKLRYGNQCYATDSSLPYG